MTPYMYYKLFITDDMMDKAAYHTNLYSVQKNGVSIKTTKLELETAHWHVSPNGFGSDAKCQMLLGGRLPISSSGRCNVANPVRIADDKCPFR